MQTTWSSFKPYLRELCRYEEVVVLRAAITEPRPALGGLSEMTGDPDRIYSVCHSLGNRIRFERIQQRLGHGLRCFLLDIDSRPAAATWVIPDGTRFLDETAYLFPVPANACWLRDLFVAPELRGRGIFRRVLDELIAGPFSAYEAIWSDLAIHNSASLRAHVRFGFTEVARFRYAHLARCILIRRGSMDGIADWTGYRTDRSIVCTAREFWHYVQEHLA